MRYLAINPYFVPFLSVVVMMVAFFYPNDAWKVIFSEPNLSYLNIEMLGWVLLCLFFLYIGIFIADNLFIYPECKDEVFRAEADNLAWIVVPVLIVTLIALLLFFGYLIVSHPGLVFYTLTGKGALVKEMIQHDELNFSTLPNFAVPIIWWAWYRYWQFKPTDKEAILIKWSLFFVTLFLIFILVVIVARFALMPMFIGLFIIYAKFCIFDRQDESKHFFQSLKLYFFLLASIIILFSLFSLARGYSEIEKLLEMVLGYGPVSFNRLAYLLEGELTFEYSMTGVYLIPEPFFSILKQFIAIPSFTPLDLWHSEFIGVKELGINEQFIWLTQFGYAYDSAGLYSIFIFFLYGVVFGWLWKSFLAGSLSGVVLYPFIYFSIFFLFGSFFNVIFFPYFVFILLVLYLWEFLVSLLIYASAKGNTYVK